MKKVLQKTKSNNGKDIKLIKYISPQIKESEIKPSYFLSNINFFDKFNIMGEVLAQYDGYGDSYGDNGGSQSGYDAYTGGNDGTGGYDSYF